MVSLSNPFLSRMADVNWYGEGGSENKFPGLWGGVELGVFKKEGAQLQAVSGGGGGGRTWGI